MSRNDTTCGSINYDKGADGVSDQGGKFSQHCCAEDHSKQAVHTDDSQRPVANSLSLSLGISCPHTPSATVDRVQLAPGCRFQGRLPRPSPAAGSPWSGGPTPGRPCNCMF